MRKTMFFMAISSLLFLSCNKQEGEDLVKTPEKDGGREVILSSMIVGDSILHITTEKVWVNKKMVAKYEYSFKTKNLPKVSDTIEDENGDVQILNHDVKMPIFVTVK